MRHPRPSVVIPVYESWPTLAACLGSVRSQTLRPMEVIVVDSGPTDRCEMLVRESFPEARIERCRAQTWPHAARNIGANVARGDPLVFTDPDVYAEPTWLERLTGAVDARHVAVGAVACYGRRWLDTGVHFAKYHSWLPGMPPGEVPSTHAASLAVPRDIWEVIGPFAGEWFAGDTLFGWRARERGYGIRFVPDAVVHHHHLVSFGAFLRERFERGREFAAMRAAFGGSALERAARFAATVLPLRLVRTLALRAARAASAGQLSRFACTAPVVVSGIAAWFAGEAASMIHLPRRS